MPTRGHWPFDATSPFSQSCTNALRPSACAMRSATKDLDGLDDTGNLIGSGAFGEVRLVTWRKTPAAAKVAHSTMPTAQKNLFLRELELMVRCRHPNIVQFLGYVDSPFVIVMEYLPNGDLRQYWRSKKLSVGHKTQICIDVLRALAYLHNRKPSSIIHRDIKPTNVLMTKSGVAKLTDFGLGRLMGQDASKHSGKEPGDVYSPPELNAMSSAKSLPDATTFTGTGESERDPSAHTPIRRRRLRCLSPLGAARRAPRDSDGKGPPSLRPATVQSSSRPALRSS